jgi:purine-binding chemotaxis protein CheW
MADGQLFGLLCCGGTEIAVSGSELVEVVGLGDGLMPAPSVPPYVIGLLDLRGSPVPVIDLAVLLGRRSAPVPTPIVAVIVNHGYRLGIAADELGPLVRAEPADIHAIEHSPGGYPAILKAVICRPGGGGMAQVLDLAALLTSESLPLARGREGRSKAAAEQRIVHLVFTCANRSFALPAFAVQEILEDQTIAHSPFTGGVCIGLVRSRGRVVPVIDVAELLGLPSVVRQPLVELVVLLTPDGPVALQVSRRENILSWQPAEIVPTTAMGEVRRGLIRGLARNGEAEVFVLDPDALAAPDVRALAKGHSDLFGRLDGSAGPGAAKGSARATAAAASTRGADEARAAYLIFEAGLTWLVAMDQVVEIIAAPAPAELRGAVSARLGGVLIHRSRSVSFIDLCGLVGAQSGPEPHGILVRGEGQFFGFQVSRVMATLKAALRRPAIRILSTSRGEHAALVRRHASFACWTEPTGVRSAVLLDLSALALDAYSAAADEALPVETGVMA